MKNKFSLIFALAIAFLIAGCSNKTDKASLQTTETENSIPEPEPSDNKADSIDNIQAGEGINSMDENRPASSNTPTKQIYRIGDKISLSSEDGMQIEITLTDYGMEYGTSQYGNLAYVNYTIENTGVVDATVGESLFDMYGDDYKIDLVPYSGTILNTTISSGRKISGTLYADINMDQYTRLELECADAIFLLRDSSWVASLAGSYWWNEAYEDGSYAGGNIEIYYDEKNQLSLYGECWVNSDIGIFDSHLPSIGEDYIRFSDPFNHTNALYIYPNENGISVKQEGDTLTSYGTIIENISFTADYYWQ